MNSASSSSVRQRRGPRKKARSRMETFCCNCLASWCFTTAQSLTGSPGSSAQSRTSATKLPARVRRSGAPAEGGTLTFQRWSNAETRRARPASGVISAAVSPGVSSVSRISSAAHIASSASSSASIRHNPSSARFANTDGSSSPEISSSRLSQSDVCVAGASAS